jgi:NAD(P)-dependent dehydrogenase (short-subunit alcohol dehydrogenase family)
MTLADIVDRTAEMLVIPSFTRVGFELRRRLDRWEPLERFGMRGRVVAVTGPTSGIGEVAATALARQGARVLLIARNEERAAATRERIEAATGNADLEVYGADLSDLPGARRVAEAIRGSEERLDVLIHNAGALLTERQTSTDGYEMTFATMVLGPFVLTEDLVPMLEESDDARIVTVTSGGMYTQPMHVDDLQMEHEPYRGTLAYARAKRAQVVLTRLWANQQRDTSVVAHAMHPGWTDTPGIEASLPRFHRLVGPLLRTPEQGADTMIWLASAPPAARSTGRLWLDRRVRPFDRLPGTRVSAEDARRLWEACRRLADATRGGSA